MRGGGAGSDKAANRTKQRGSSRVGPSSGATGDGAPFEGYIVDLLDRICQLLGLRYQLAPAPDGEYGQQATDGFWNGMIRQLVDRVMRHVTCHVPGVPGQHV